MTDDGGLSGSPGLLAGEALERSAVVANCAMNRERGLDGYIKELGLDVLAELRVRLERQERVRWVDLCCGEGRALIEAAHHLRGEGVADRVDLIGVDLVDYFAAPAPPGTQWVTGSATVWEPQGRVDLVTCVHGLHYVGNKLKVLTRAASWLTEPGIAVANFDAKSIRLADGTPAGPRVAAALRAAGLTHDSRRRRITCHGRKVIDLPYRYLGADDQAGPNYTGQPSVNSFYSPAYPTGIAEPWV